MNFSPAARAGNIQENFTRPRTSWNSTNWTEQEVDARLIQLMQNAYKEVQQLAVERSVDLRTAALMRGIERVSEAKRRRGVFP